MNSHRAGDQLSLNSREPIGIDAAALIQAGFRYALSLTHHLHDAEDLTQQACMKVLRAKGTLVSKSYLFATIRNQFVDTGRCRGESQAPEGSIELLAEQSPNQVNTVDRRLDLEQILGCLRMEEREALFLNCVEGYTASEIAEITGQPRGTVLSHLSRAKTRIQRVRSMQDQVETR